MKKNLSRKYEKFLLDNYRRNIDNSNYKDLILEGISSHKAIHRYLKDYIKNNKEVLDLNWGKQMLLFIISFNEKDLELAEICYKSLKKYPDNYFTESVMADINLRFYGNLFKARDKYLNALNLYDRDALVYYNLGLIYYLLGMFKKSMDFYNKSLNYINKMDNKEFIKSKCLYNIAVCEINYNNNYKEGEKLLKRSLKLNPHYKEANDLLEKLRGEK
ncbi:hypothetical protein EXN25_00085 [Clostridium botulinum]|uniref:hypothetical protein n=1 Tax=Clostridium botulinum TaxID=1491 RepID=UPI0001F84D52|nr:hypothetical protein [Clostridium botulinum]NFB17427.1 hypothetical protein [Clostridium botulinum]NFB68162.1 hypothetical protein [Clostridium botulinum]NFB99129.1 hypothetical protein [Clostridium botulinum]NFC48105.1 hypothetical protein [Clostridium botulinum]NFC59328.1 hypothetical protein [Clostridium botulinum]